MRYTCKTLSRRLARRTSERGAFRCCAVHHKGSHDETRWYVYRQIDGCRKKRNNVFENSFLSFLICVGNMRFSSENHVFHTRKILQHREFKRTFVANVKRVYLKNIQKWSVENVLFAWRRFFRIHIRMYISVLHCGLWSTISSPSQKSQIKQRSCTTMI